MKDPKHPLGPAFAQAQDEAEVLRRQQITALSAPERTAYDALCRAQQAKEQALREALRLQEKDRVAERTERHLWRRDLQPRPRTPQHKEELTAPQATPLDRAARDHAAGLFIRQRLKDAQTRAETEITRENTQALERTRAAHQRERDAFLERCGRERHMPAGKSYERRPDAPEVKWHLALEKAARQEKDRDRDLDRGHDYGRDYRYGR